MSTEISRWWAALGPDVRAWLIDHNGERLTPEISAQVARAGGPSGRRLTDEDVDWIEGVANGEPPTPAGS